MSKGGHPSQNQIYQTRRPLKLSRDERVLKLEALWRWQRAGSSVVPSYSKILEVGGIQLTEDIADLSLKTGLSSYRLTRRVNRRGRLPALQNIARQILIEGEHYEDRD